LGFATTLDSSSSIAEESRAGPLPFLSLGLLPNTSILKVSNFTFERTGIEETNDQRQQYAHRSDHVKTMQLLLVSHFIMEDLGE
jgi:hypothetical protein